MLMKNRKPQKTLQNTNKIIQYTGPSSSVIR